MSNEQRGSRLRRVSGLFAIVVLSLLNARCEKLDDECQGDEEAGQDCPDVPPDGGTGGTQPEAGSGGRPSVMDVVAELDFESDTLGDWEPNTEDRDSGRSIAPPELKAGEKSSVSWDCDGKGHTGFSFWWRGKADLLVDGELYETLPNTAGYGGGERTIIVPDGKHEYTFEVTGPDAGGRPELQLDSFECTRTEAYAVEEAWSFENGFIPLELEGLADPSPASTWQITDEDSPSEDGKFTVRAPLLRAGEELALTTRCADKPHTQFSFWWSGTADLYVDDELYETLPNNAGFRGGERTIVVPEGKHEYRFEVVGPDAGGRPEIQFDAFACTRTEPHAAENGEWSFENGFVPPEFDELSTSSAASTWQIVNEPGPDGGGDFSLRAPLMEAGAKLSLTTRCGDKPHSQFGFWWSGTADLYVDGELRETLPDRSGFGGEVYELMVSTGEHEYRLEVSAPEEGGRPPLQFDEFACSGE